MWPVIAAAAAVAAGAYAIITDFMPKKALKPPPPGVLPPKPVTPLPLPVTPVAPHKVPGGLYVYTAPQAAPDLVQAAATALAAVNPGVQSSEQLVRNFQGAAGLAQLNGGPGWDSVSPPGTDGRYGHDVAAVLSKYVPNAPAPCTRATVNWWGKVGSYTNP